MSDKDARELENIKKLLILFLVKLGTTSPEIGSALGIDDSAVRRLVPAKKVKKFAIPYAE